MYWCLSPATWLIFTGFSVLHDRRRMRNCTAWQVVTEWDAFAVFTFIIVKPSAGAVG